MNTETDRFICSSPRWDLSGVNTFTGNLLRGLIGRGCDGEIILTETGGQPPPYPLPGGIPVHELPVTRWGENRRRQQLLRDRLVNQAPCIYLPNYDFNHLPVIEILPPEVKVVLVAHSDEEAYFAAISKYGHAANAIVPVSKTIEARLRSRHPAWNDKIRHVPCGVPLPGPDEPENSSEGGESLHVVYSGRLSQLQKRVFDLAEVILACRRDRLPVRFSIAGSGPEEGELKRRLDAAAEDGTVAFTGLLPSSEMHALFAKADVVILTSDYEGLPLTLLEAMARRCVPVVTRIASGINEVVRDGENGRTIEIGNVEGFEAALADLARDRAALQEMAERAVRTIQGGPFHIERAVEDYLGLAHFCGTPAARAERRTGKPQVPVHYSFSYRLRKRLGNIAPLGFLAPAPVR